MESYKFGPVYNLFRKIWFLWILCVLVNSIAFFIIRFKINPGNKTMALYWNVIAGVEWYGKGKNLYFIPIAGLVICLTNFILYRAFKQTKSFLPLLIVFVTFCVQVAVLAAILFLANIN